MVEHGDNQNILAAALGISRVTLSRKINEKEETKGFSQPEISTIIKRYNLTDKQVNDIFFAD